MLAHFVSMSSCSVCDVVDKKGMGRTEREDNEEKERKSVLGERRKRKAATPKAQTHKSKKQTLFSLFFFSL